MKGHLGRPAGFIFNRAQFSQNLQRPCDSVVQYLLTLKELARRCEFRDKQLDERVRDQFGIGCINDRIQERLLQELANQSLDFFVTLAVAVEPAPVKVPALGTQFDAAAASLDDYRDRKSSNSRYKV